MPSSAFKARCLAFNVFKTGIEGGEIGRFTSVLIIKSLRCESFRDLGTNAIPVIKSWCNFLRSATRKILHFAPTSHNGLNEFSLEPEALGSKLVDSGSLPHRKQCCHKRTLGTAEWDPTTPPPFTKESPSFCFPASHVLIVSRNLYLHSGSESIQDFPPPSLSSLRKTQRNWNTSLRAAKCTTAPTAFPPACSK